MLAPYSGSDLLLGSQRGSENRGSKALHKKGDSYLVIAAENAKGAVALLLAALLDY